MTALPESDLEAAVDALAEDEAALVARTRALLGVTGRAERFPLGATLRASGVGSYAIVAVCALAAADAGVATSIPLVRDGVRRSIGAGALGSYPPLAIAAFVAGAMGALVLLGRFPPGRATLARAVALTTGVALALAALSTSSGVVLAGALIVAAASGMDAVILAPMLIDAHPPEVRVRAAAAFAGAVGLGVGAASLVVVCGSGAGLTWRAELLLIAALSAGAAAVAGKLRDPAPGRFDRVRVMDAVRRHLGAGPALTSAGDLDQGAVALSPVQHVRRVLAVRPVRALLGAAMAFGLAARGLPPFLDTFLLARWGMVGPSRAFTGGVLWLTAAGGLLWFAPRAEVASRIAPSRLIALAASVAVAGGAALALSAVAPVFVLTALFLALGLGCLTILLATAVAGVLLLVDPERRGHAAALIGVAIVLGGLFGQQILSTIGDRFGPAWALQAAAAVVLLVGAELGRTVPLVDGELDALLGRMVEVDELSTRVSRGEHLPLLSCRHVSFSYGQVQVLFGVSFTVDDGEMVALLGTNGAGKSTLLRLISGLSFPGSGAIHYRGADITFVDTDRRVQLGISQVPGGRAVFGPMSVADNLRAYGYSVGRNRARLEQGIDQCFEAFPRLAERRNQLASTLSGGEQQMLALCTALILRPRLLLIDELSLGLAPKVVGELLEMVRRINDNGTAVVLVEQSVNIALSVVDHAYFMEKGEIRFDGPAGELLARPDLLRSVFLQGATKALEGAV